MLTNDLKRELYVIVAPMGFLRGHGNTAKIDSFEHARIFSKASHAKRALECAFMYGGSKITDILRCRCKVMKVSVLESSLDYI